jgi:membrane-associated phospholipid phosphatase
VALQLPHLVDETSNSFPSGHTAFVFALATVVYPYHKRLSYFVFVSGALIGLARIMAGVHYPADVLGGMVLGVAFGAAAAIALVWFGVEAEEA